MFTAEKLGSRNAFPWLTSEALVDGESMAMAREKLEMSSFLFRQLHRCLGSSIAAKNNGS